MAPARMSFNVRRPSCCQVAKIQRVISSTVPSPLFFFLCSLQLLFHFFFSYLFIYLFLKSEFVFLIRVPLPVKTWNKKNSERERGGFSLLVLVMHHKLVERGKEKKKSVCLMYRLLRYYFFDLLVRSLLIMLFQSFFSV